MTARKLSLKTIMGRRRPTESIAALARRFNISAQSLYNFRTRQQNSKTAESEFLPVHLPQQIPSSQALCQLQFQSGIKLLIPDNADLQSLQQIVSALKEVL